MVHYLDMETANRIMSYVPSWTIRAIIQSVYSMEEKVLFEAMGIS
jgi:hypothetical protein